MVVVDEKQMAAAIMSLKRSADEVGHDCRITATNVYKEMTVSSKQYITVIKEHLDDYAQETPVLLEKVSRYYQITPEGLKYFNDLASGGFTWVQSAYDGIKKYGNIWPNIAWETELQYHPAWFKRARLPALLHDRFYLDGVNRKGEPKKKMPPTTGWEGTPVDVLA